MDSNKNNRNNGSSSEILFWKVFNNIVIRNHILSQLNSSNSNNSNGKQYRSYNGTTSLELMVQHNKIDMILDKLKSNHFIHFESIPDIYNKCRKLSRDPYFKTKVDEIYKLLWFNYSGYIKRLFNRFPTPIAIYKLWYINGNSGSNNYNNYREYDLFYECLTLNDSKNAQYINNIFKVYQINQNIDQQEFIRQLSNSNSNSITLDKSIEEEIKDSIYNNKEILVNANHYYAKIRSIDLDSVISKPIDIKSILLNSTNISIENCTNIEILESIYIALLYKSSLQVRLSGRGLKSVDNILLAKIKVLNKLNQESDSSSNIGVIKFKQYLKENKVDTLDELIWIARDTIDMDDIKGLEHYFGYHYQYLYLVSKYSNIQLQNKNLPQPNEITKDLSLVLCYSVINQSIEALDNEFEFKKYYNIPIEYYLPQVNQLDGSSNDDNENNDQSIRDKSTQYFNHLLKRVGCCDSADQLAKWMSIFEIIIYNYNSKLFDWLLDSNQALRDIYYQLLSDYDYFYILYSAHSRFNRDTNQINYGMLDIYLKHVDSINGFKFTTKYLVKSDKSYFNQQSLLILNHIIKSTTSTTTNNNSNNKYKRSRNQFEINNSNNVNNNSNSFKRSLVKILVLMGFRYENVDQVTEIYNQIDQQSLSNFFNNIQDDDDDDIGLENEILENAFKCKAYNNKSSILVVHLINSSIDLDFESINKIISTTLNSNNSNNNNSTTTSTPITINIPTTINNSIDIIKYLITNNYLKQFNLHYIITEFISKVNVDKQIILDIIKSQSININNNSNSNSGIGISLESLIDKLYIDLESIDQREREEYKAKEEKQNSRFSLQALEKTDEYDFNRAVYDYLDCGYFNTVVQFILKTNRNMDRLIHYTQYSIRNSLVSVECFSKLYPVIITNSTISSEDINELCRFNLDIFEFIWANHFKNDKERKEYLIDFLGSPYFTGHYIFKFLSQLQFTEHILQSNRELISTSLKLKQDQLFELHKNAILYGNTSIFNQVRSIYPSFKFDIDFTIIRTLITGRRYDAIEYLYENNLIPNLHQIIGDDNLNRLGTNEASIDENEINVSLSMFILVHFIIKLQQQQ